MHKRIATLAAAALAGSLVLLPALPAAADISRGYYGIVSTDNGARADYINVLWDSKDRAVLEYRSTDYRADGKSPYETIRFHAASGSDIVRQYINTGGHGSIDNRTVIASVDTLEGIELRVGNGGFGSNVRVLYVDNPYSW